MDTRHLVDPEIVPLLELMPAGTYTRETMPAIRAGAAERYALLPQPELAPVLHTIGGPDGPLEVLLFDPALGTPGRAALLHIHGGGMIMGSARLMAVGPARMAQLLGIPVASVEYRLAPETPFPGPQEDCYAALAWLAAQRAEIGLDPARIGVIGESAGGGLAAALAQMARDRGGPALAGQFLIYPMLDHRTGSDTCPHRNRTTGEFVWTRASNVFGWEALRGDYTPGDARKGWFSPSLAEDLAGLPPTVILTGSLDLFFDEDLDYARRLVDAGVPVELHSYAGAIHAFNVMAEARVARAFSRDMMTGIARVLAVPRA